MVEGNRLEQWLWPMATVGMSQLHVAGSALGVREVPCEYRRDPTMMFWKPESPTVPIFAGGLAWDSTHAEFRAPRAQVADCWPPDHFQIQLPAGHPIILCLLYVAVTSKCCLVIVSILESWEV